jgi:hypothetical protein
MKKIIPIAIAFLLLGHAAWACDVCQKNQPTGFKNITHGAGPTGTIDYFIMGASVVIVIFTLYLSFKYLIKPKEGSPDHIKNIVKNEGF